MPQLNLPSASPGSTFSLDPLSKAVLVALTQDSKKQERAKASGRSSQSTAPSNKKEVTIGSEQGYAFLRKKTLLKPIEEIQVGDEVWAWDEHKGEPVARSVKQLFRR